MAQVDPVEPALAESSKEAPVATFASLVNDLRAAKKTADGLRYTATQAVAASDDALQDVRAAQDALDEFVAAQSA